MFLDKVISIRLRKEELENIEKIIECDGFLKYDNVSHFIRCAVMNLINQSINKEKNRGV